jgi:hypothetical protein
VGHIPDTEEIIHVSWSLFHHDGAAACKLSERSPLPQPLSAMDIPGERTQILNIWRIGRINRHPVETDENSAPETISDCEEWLNWNVDLDNSNDSKDNCGVDAELYIE